VKVEGYFQKKSRILNSISDKDIYVPRLTDTFHKAARQLMIPSFLAKKSEGTNFSI